jgi:hypothetical protein
MYSEMELWTTPLTTQPFLLECDTDLVKKSLSIFLDPPAENLLSPETIQFIDALYQYIQTCNKAFLASEKIRVFLSFCLLTVFVTSFIMLASLPVSITGMILIGVMSFLIASVNIFNLNQSWIGCQQEIDSEILKNCCSDSEKNLTLRKLTILPYRHKASEKKLSYVFDVGLFTPKKALNEKSFNEENVNSQTYLPGMNEEFFEASIESNSNQSSRTF